VAKNASLAGKAGQHKDKKKAEKQGDVKHKKEIATMESALSELSTEKLAQYKKAAGADAKKADADGNYSQGDKRFKGINRATNKQFDNDLKKHGVAERVRDPEDWDEGNTEPPNNFAVYINGKKWKVFKGRGRYADDDREQAHYQQLKDWAAKKSASTGKQWTVSITGETATESLDEVSWKGIKQGAAAAGLAGAMTFGAGGANARTTPGDDPNINRLTGKPIATQQATDNAPAKAEAPKGYNKEYLQKAADPNRTGRYMISVEKAQELLKQMDKKVGEGSMFAGAKVGHKEGPAGQWRNDGAKKNKPARPGDLVGDGT
jgi:hypothetical protein